MITGYITGGIIVLIGVIDIALILKYGKKASISAWMINYAKKHPSMPFLIGFAMGHLFWVMDYFDYAPHEQIVKECKEYIANNP